MVKDYVAALIVAKPGRLRDGLQALLKMIPQIAIVGQADDGPSALRMIAEHHPTLVFLDTNLPSDGVQTVLLQAKTRYSQTRCIVLANNDQQRQAAKASGADGVLLKGFPVTKLFTTIERLLL